MQTPCKGGNVILRGITVRATDKLTKPPGSLVLGILKGDDIMTEKVKIPTVYLVKCQMYGCEQMITNLKSQEQRGMCKDHLAEFKKGTCSNEI